MSSPEFAAFSEAEHRERLQRARQQLRAAGIELCIAVAPEDLYYLAGYDSWVSVNSPQALLFSVTQNDEPTLVVRDVDVVLATESSWVKDIRSYHLYVDDVAALIAQVAREKGLMDGPVAMELQSYALPHSLGCALTQALSPAHVIDATTSLGDLRVVKSATEHGYTRQAARYANYGLDAARAALKSGIMEIELAGAIEGAMRSAGSDYWSIPTELSSGLRTPGGHATPRDRAIQTGELVHMEFAGVHQRYHAVAIHTMALGDPGSRARQVYEAVRTSLRAGLDVIRPGVAVSEVEQASLEPLRQRNLDEFALMRFGYGIGIAYPPIWLETLQISRGFDRTLQPGMVFVLHGYVQLLDEGIGVIQGGTWALTDSGLEMLVGGGDVGLEVI
ncbi:MAG: Xaa-Pro peptidase family protein [Gammaproteobacteria bacterium]|nr:Xaa-Pro peptidase family protein [Gammaproteobacteria bacterium]